MPIRRIVSLVREWRATRPRLIPFAPIVLRHVLRIGRRGVLPLPGPKPPPQGRRLQPPTAVSDLTVFSVIRNGITNGYPFIEAYASWLDVAGRILILDGESDDGTRASVDALAALDPRIEIMSRPWPAVELGGAAIAEFTNTALELAAPAGGRLMYVQADEIYTPAQRQQVLKHKNGALEFAGCINFWNSFETVTANDFPMRYTRLFPASQDAHSVGDGFSFETPGIPLRHTSELILHYGWCFPSNILRKHVAHAAIYRDHPGYVARGALARVMLEQRRTDRHLLDALLPQYEPVPFAGQHPASVRHLLGMDAYDPAVGLALLADGVNW